MLSTRNKRLKRISRIFAFFVIILSGCWYQFKLLLDNFYQYGTSEEFVNESVFVPPWVKGVYNEYKDGDVAKRVKWKNDHKYVLVPTNRSIT